MEIANLHKFEKAVRSVRNLQDVFEVTQLHKGIGNHVFQLYASHRIPKPEALGYLTATYKQLYDASIRLETEALNHKFKEHAQVLGPDRHEVRTSQWFRDTGLAFSTGVPGVGIVCTILDPEVGMAASHLNSLTMADYAAFMNSALDYPKLLDKASFTNPYGLIIKPASLKSNVTEAANLAYTDFVEMSGKGINLAQAQIHLAGLGFVPQNLTTDYTLIAFNTIKRRIFESLGGHYIAPTPLIIFERLGKSEGIIYGGKNHPRYSSPQYFNFKANF